MSARFLKRIAIGAALFLAIAGCTSVLGTFDVSTDAIGVSDAGEAGSDSGGGSSVDGAVNLEAASTPDAASADASGGPCTVAGGASMGCAADEVCASPNCATGTCTKVAQGAIDYAPVCGCDSVNYWNQSVAASFLAAVQSKGECATPATCSGAASAGKCSVAKGQKLDCAFERGDLGATCGAGMTAVCWGLPNKCPQTNAVTSCGVGSTCLALCDAIQQQTAYRTVACTLK